MNVLYLQEQRIPKDQTPNIDSIGLEFSSNKENRSSSASQIQISGDAARLIRSYVIDDYGNMPAKVVRECCGKQITLISGNITFRDVKWCETNDGCGFLEVQIINEQIEDNAYKCIRQKIVSANTEYGDTTFWKYNHPFVRYCDDPRPAAVRYLIITLGILLLFGMQAMIPIYLFVGAIYNAVKAVIELDPQAGFDGIQQWYQNLFILMNNILQELQGCGRGHIQPFVRDYLNNVCKQCGITLQDDTPFTDANQPYIDTMWFEAPMNEGRTEYNLTTKKKYFTYNAPVITGGAMLDRICGLMNHKWYISGNILHIQPQQQTKTVWYDQQINGNILKEICYDTTSESIPAIEEWRYAVDQIDGVGDEARFLYNDIVSYNDPFNPAYDGMKQNDFLFGAQRFRGDLITPDVLDTYQDLINALQIALNALSFQHKNIIEGDIKNLLLIEKGKCANPKLLIKKKQSQIENQKIMNDGANFNYPFWFDFQYYDSQRYANQPEQEKRTYGDNLQKFWIINDPRNTGMRGFRFTLEIDFDCPIYISLIDMIEYYGVNFQVRVPFRGQYVVANVDNVKLNDDNMEITGTF